MGKLSGKTALITGGTSGIGLATAKLFQAEGAKLIVTGRDEEHIAQTQKDLGPDALIIQSEASDLKAIEHLADQVKNRFLTLDILFLNAGVARSVAIENVTEAQFDEIMDINVKGVFFTVQKIIPLFSSEASVIVTTSIINQLGSPNFSVYGASKAALRALVKSFAMELIGKGIRVNAISPGPIDTPIYDRFGLPEDAAKALKKRMLQKTPAKRFGTSEEIAKVALFLSTDDSSFILGDEILVDGGFTL